MEGEGRHERNGNEPPVQRQWMAMDGTMTTRTARCKGDGQHKDNSTAKDDALVTQ